MFYLSDFTYVFYCSGCKYFGIQSGFIYLSSFYCYVLQCWLIYAISLELSKGTVSHILLFVLGELWYTMLIFRFASLCMLRWYLGDIMWQWDTIINLYYFSIFQFHNNNTTNISNINVHLTVIVSLRVPPLLTFNLSNLDVIPLLFNSVSSFPSPYLDSCLT